jgi:hypothetical protein
MSTKRLATILASISAVALVADAFAASAQDYPPDYNQAPSSGYYQGQPSSGYDQGQYQQDQYQQGYQGQPQSGYEQGYQQGYDQYNAAPPRGQYAPPPPGADSRSYDYRNQQYDRDYAGRYSAWAAQNCVDRRNNNTAAGAIIGGVLGALVGSAAAGHHERGEGAVVGGVLGAGAGAVIGSSSTDTRGCPPGYVVRRGAPAFYYAGPAYGSAYWGPSWYQPWVWIDGRWVYHPYREWYYSHPTYWRTRRYHYY